MNFLQFTDRLIPYDTFLNDVAATVVRFLETDKDDPEIISQRKAYEMFGRSNVDRWHRDGKIEPCKRPGRLEYRTAELRFLQRIKRDDKKD